VAVGSLRGVVEVVGLKAQAGVSSGTSLGTEDLRTTAEVQDLKHSRWCEQQRVTKNRPCHPRGGEKARRRCIHGETL
jgi:hypothetical protein